MSENIPEKESAVGLQPIIAIIEELELKPHDLVAASTEQLTHKMVTKVINGRRVSVNIQMKLMAAVNKVTGKEFKRTDLFNYK